MDAIARMMAREPDAIAIEAGDSQVSYVALHEWAGAIASRLSTGQVAQGDVVAVCLQRSPAQLAAMLASWWIGAAYLPLDPTWPDRRIAELIERAGCAAVIVDEDRAHRVAGSTPVISPTRRGTGIWAARAPIAATDLAYVIFTSGSTGVPKAVEVTHGNLAALIDWHCAAFEVREGTRTSHLAGLGFDAAAWEVWPTLSTGGTIVLVDNAVRTDWSALRDWLVGERIEVAFVPTALAEPMVTTPWPAGAALRILLTGADKLTVRPQPGQPFVFVNNYGPTESTVVATSGIVAPDGNGLPSIGRPIAGTQIHLLDAAGEEVLPGQEGEIAISGAQVARGYRGDAELTAERFIDHPSLGRLYRTGDLGLWLDNGELAFRGRVDQQAKVRGHRIEPAEIAAALNRLPAVSASAVVAHEGELVAYVVPVEGQDPLARDLRAALAETLPDYMIPARFVRLAALPLNSSGKVDRAALPDPARHAMDEAPAGRPPSTPTEARLLEIVCGVIGRNDIGVDEDFFLLGGHSLLGTQVVVRARDAFGVDLSLFHLFEGRTVEKLAVTVEKLVIEKLESMSPEDIQRMAAL
jgi:amino acid adenylation domain-containing protein